jgi:xanthine dehydrogenase accessory factor
MDPMVDFFERVAALQREGKPFAMATVVGRRAPVSAHLGDRAIVFADGRMEGFVGGACSREIIRRQALDAMRTRRGRLVSIRPDAGDDAESTAEHVVVPMTCVSEGAADIYVEPFVQARLLVVVGATPVADALARLARTMDYQVARVVDAREQADIAAEAAALAVQVATLDTLEAVLHEAADDTAAVVASQGHYDEQALESILKRGLPYIGLVASRKRGAMVRMLLEESGARGVAAIRNPAGLDLGARTAPEIALSILAEIVQGQSKPVAQAVTEPSAAMPGPPTPVARAVDPVCGMDVDIAGARHTAELGGVSYYFCCASCRSRFLNDPQSYQPHAS